MLWSLLQDHPLHGLRASEQGLGVIYASPVPRTQLGAKETSGRRTG